jgi:hypothetical protein
MFGAGKRWPIHNSAHECQGITLRTCSNNIVV